MILAFNHFKSFSELNFTWHKPWLEYISTVAVLQELCPIVHVRPVRLQWADIFRLAKSLLWADIRIIKSIVNDLFWRPLGNWVQPYDSQLPTLATGLQSKKSKSKQERLVDIIAHTLYLKNQFWPSYWVYTEWVDFMSSYWLGLLTKVGIELSELYDKLEWNSFQLELLTQVGGEQPWAFWVDSAQVATIVIYKLAACCLQTDSY